MTAQACYDEMNRLGVGIATAHFGGGNDEGGYDEDVEFTMADQTRAVPSVLDGYDPYRRDDPIAAHLNAVLDGEYGGFAGDFNVYGNVIVNAAARTTRIAGEESQYVGFERVL